VLVLGGAGPAWSGELSAPLEEYRAAIVTNPRTAINYFRVFLYGRNNPAHRKDARALLEWCFQKYPRGHRIEMFIAWLDQLEGKPGWEIAFRRSIDGMRSTGDDYGVTYAGEILAYILIDQGRLDAAERLLTSCLPAATRTGKTWMQARIWSVQAVLAQVRGDYSTALHLLRQIRKDVFPDGDYDIQCSVTTNLGNVYWYLGHYRRAFEAYEEAARLRATSGDVWGESIPVSNMALCALELVHQGEMEPHTLDELIQRALTLSRKGGNADVEASMYNLLGQRSHGREALRHFDQALAIERRHALRETKIESLRFSGNALAAMGASFAGRARLAFEKAEEEARTTRHLFQLGGILADEARFTTLTAPFDQAVTAHLRAIDYIESLRAPQVRGTIRARAFSHWSYVYYRLAGFLLTRARGSATPEQDRALAFNTMERFRARELLERLDTPRKESTTPEEQKLQEDHLAVLTRISGVQRALADPELGPARRRAALKRLEDLEEEERYLRDRLNRRYSRVDDHTGSGIPGLREIQSLLKPDQALLAYQLSDGEPWARPHLEIGSSWLVLLTRNRVWSIPVPARRDLRGRIRILNGLLTAPGASSATVRRASARVYDDLLGKAMAALPDRIRRLVIVPDDVLCHCPFAALQPAGGKHPVGYDFEISTVPSASVWARLKRMNPEIGRSRRSAALIFYAPSAGQWAEGGDARRAAGPWRNGLRLAPLPHAAEEARSLLRSAGPGSRMLSGPDASEAALKRMPLDAYGIVDLVTHAAVDDEQPERSSIILAPGSTEEDGFLQVREIPELDLDGQLIILSSCSSSSGRILGGEGAESLARAFLEGGAGAVLASLWPLEDEQAASLFGDLSRELGRGRRVSDALRRAQRHAVDRGMPVEAWAGVIVLGDGDLAPLPAGGVRGARSLLAAMIVLMLLGALLIRRIR